MLPSTYIRSCFPRSVARFPVTYFANGLLVVITLDLHSVMTNAKPTRNTEAREIAVLCSYDLWDLRARQCSRRCETLQRRSCQGSASAKIVRTASGNALTYSLLLQCVSGGDASWVPRHPACSPMDTVAAVRDESRVKST